MRQGRTRSCGGVAPGEYLWNGLPGRRCYANKIDDGFEADPTRRTEDLGVVLLDADSLLTRTLWLYQKSWVLRLLG